MTQVSNSEREPLGALPPHHFSRPLHTTNDADAMSNVTRSALLLQDSQGETTDGTLAAQLDTVTLILIGPPGSGKGTQAARLGRRLGVPVVSTGDILRRAVQADTHLGRAVKAVMERGELIADEMMTEIVGARLRDVDTVAGCVLDGFPRTVAQAIALEDLMAHRGLLIAAELAVPDTILVRRLNSRRICDRCGTNQEPAVNRINDPDRAGSASGGAERCRCGAPLQSRPDDHAEVVRERLRIYDRDTKPLLNFYAQRRVLRVIDGTLAPDAVAAQLASAVVQAARGYRQANRHPN
jgi:adenylate kinase